MKKGERIMYSFEQLMCPVWDSDVIYDEFLTMVRSNGVAQAPLLHKPLQILSVTSADKTAVYEEGKDWVLCGDMLQLTENSRAFAFREAELVFSEPKPGESFATKDGHYSLFHEGHFFHDRQLSVTYKAAKIGDFSVPYCGDQMGRMMEKLKNREILKIVLFGDSISEGANSSGMSLTTPFLPTWGRLFSENLRRHYGTKVQFINTSVGGMDSCWAVENAAQAVAAHEPDVAIIAFGMNDKLQVDDFIKNMEQIMQTVLEKNPLAEFVLCVTTAPNPILKNFNRYQNDYRQPLLKLQKPGTVIADFNGLQKYLLERKRFIDLTGNNVNHPNDFMIRCHAQVLSDMFIQR